MKTLRTLAGMLLLCAVATPPTAAHMTDGPQIDIRAFARDADFIFKGRVIGVRYRESENVILRDASGAPILDENGAPRLQDGSGIPHTFVTYAVEQTYKGRARGRTFTLRFFGGAFDALVTEIDPTTGQQETGTEVYLAGELPLFDVGDRDLLFVKNNTAVDCPLTRCETGRFRLLPRPVAEGGGTAVYTDTGYEVLRIPPAVAATNQSEVEVGPFHQRAEVQQNTIASAHFNRVSVELPNEFSDPEASAGDPPDETRTPRGSQFTEASFDAFVHQIVLSTLTLRELLRLRPARSADPRQPFVARPWTVSPHPPDEPEVVTEPERPWIDRLPPEERRALLQAEQEEEEAFAASGGNPVLPPRSGN